MIDLVKPGAAWLPGYVAALEAGWSQSTTRDLSGEQLAAVRADAAAFLAEQCRESGGELTLDDGRVVPRLSQRVRWMVDGGEFCGSINLRFQPGTLALPAHVSGHVGYTVVPWMRGRGVATAALRAMVGLAAELRLAQISVTCDVGNGASAAVIRRAGGVEGEGAAPGKRLFWIVTGG